MRKLLLGTTALAAAATLSANVAVADVSVGGFIEWKYQSTSSNLTASDGTSTTTDADVRFKFSNKTDSGLNVGYYAEINTDGGDDSSVEESYLHISGGFGKIVLGTDDGVGDYYGVAASDLPSEEITATGTSSDISIRNADYANLSSNAQVMAYHFPAMGGLTGGISYFNSGVAGDADSTEVALRYTMDAGGANITLGGASATKENSTQDIDSQVIGVKVTSGNVTVAASQSTHEGSASDEESNGIAASFKVSDAMSLTGYTFETDEDAVSETYEVTGAEVKYSIASGLTAFLTVEDYDYKPGTSGGNADSGTASKLTIQASF